MKERVNYSLTILYMAHMKPKGAKGKTQVKKLGRNYKTGGFKKIAEKAEKEYGSKEEGKRVAGAVFNKMAKAHAAKTGGMAPSYSKKY